MILSRSYSITPNFFDFKRFLFAVREIKLQNHCKKEAENPRRGHKAKTVINQTRMKSFGRFPESGRGPGLSSGAAQSRRPPVQLC